jgi:hypothetical protein
MLLNSFSVPEFTAGRERQKRHPDNLPEEDTPVQISATKDGAGKVAQVCPILGCSPVVRDFIGQLV